MTNGLVTIRPGTPQGGVRTRSLRSPRSLVGKHALGLPPHCWIWIHIFTSTTLSPTCLTRKHIHPHQPKMSMVPDTSWDWKLALVSLCVNDGMEGRLMGLTLDLAALPRWPPNFPKTQLPHLQKGNNNNSNLLERPTVDKNWEYACRKLGARSSPHVSYYYFAPSK